MEDRYLFRGKTIRGDWVRGLLASKDNKWYIGNKVGRPFAFEIRPESICQCTGLKDKNGKLIWENDICDRKEEYPEIVKYNDGDWTLDYSYSKGKESGYCYCNLGFYVLERKCVEVIGNIFDNPELFEV